MKGKLANGMGSQYCHAISERGVCSITQADAHTSAASSRLNLRPHRFKWTRPFRGKTKSGFCACAITFRTSYTTEGSEECSINHKKIHTYIYIVFSSVLFNLNSQYIIKVALERFGHFNMGGQVILSVKYADNLMLRVKEETKKRYCKSLTEIERCYGMAMNMEQIKVKRTSKQHFSVQVMIFQNSCRI